MGYRQQQYRGIGIGTSRFVQQIHRSDHKILIKAIKITLYLFEHIEMYDWIKKLVGIMLSSFHNTCDQFAILKLNLTLMKVIDHH